MARLSCSHTTNWHVAKWFAGVLILIGVGFAALAGCSGDADSHGPDHGAVTGLEDSSDAPTMGANGNSSSRGSDDDGPGSAARENGDSLARIDGNRQGSAPHFPSGNDFPQPIPAAAGEGDSVVDPGVPELPEDVALQRPIVVLSAGHEALCRLRVGDNMPDFSLADLAGQDQSLQTLLGTKLTVVVFWTLQHPYAAEQFERLGAEVVSPYAEFGVNVVAINVGDEVESVRAASQRVGATFPILLDFDGAVFDLVATEKLPRTYLLDPSGRILWFDIEYSESTRRELNNAILWHLVREPIIATR